MFTPMMLVPTNLLQDRMYTTTAVVGGLRIEPSIVVIQNQVLAFVTHDIGDALPISFVLGDDKC